VSLTPTFSAHINFSNNTTEVPAGYLNDIGNAYGTKAGGLTYGWNVDSTPNAADRASPTSPDERYDSFIARQQAPNRNATGTIAVPNGTYSVHLAVGDPSATNSKYRINVQTVLAVSGTPTAKKRWFENTVSVTVTNGLLVVSNAGGAKNNK